MIGEHIHPAVRRARADAERAAGPRRRRLRPNWMRWLVLIYCLVSWVLLGLLLGWLLG